MRRIKQISSIFLVLVLLLSGCAGKEDIPELIAPVVNNQSYRPVGYGEVGKSEIKIADVVPEEYCHFAKNATTILEIEADVGDYVEAGDVLATMDVEDFQLEVDRKNAEITLTQSIFQTGQKKCQQQIKLQKLQKKVCEEKGDTKGAKECDTQIAVVEENMRYDELLYKHQVTMLQEEIAALKESIEEGTVRAGHSGYVTYVKDLSETAAVESMENIVIVSDYDDLHLELTEDLSSTFYTAEMGRFNQSYTVIEGKQYEVEPYDYTNEEMIAIQSAGAYPKIHLEIKNAVKGLQPGDKIPVYFVSGGNKKSLKIGADSLYTEGDKYFVYVKNGEKKEKREIQVGTINSTDVEVKDGLKEGEWVFYSSNAIMPEQYEEYTVGKQVYSPESGEVGLKSKTVYTKLYSYTCQEPATVESLKFTVGDTVKKGDLICVLDTEGGSANIKEAENAINNLKIDYEKSKKSSDDQIAALDKQISSLKKKKKQQEREEKQKKGEAEDTVNEMSTGEITAIQTSNEVMEPDTTAEETGGDESQTEAATEKAVTEETTQAETTENPEVKNEAPAEEDGDKEETGDSGDSSPAESEEGITDNEIEQLECQRNILVYDRDILKAQYEYNLNMLQQEYEREAKSNNGHGKIEVCAGQNGVLGNVNIYEGKQIKPEEDSSLFQIYDETSKKLMIDTNKDYVGTGNEVSFVSEQNKEKSYTGKVVGNSAVQGKVYLSESHDKIYVTRSISQTERNRAYIVAEDSQFDKDTMNTNVFYSKVRIQDAIVLPSAMVNEEVNKWQEDVTYYYVWKLVDGILVKQYVEMDESLNTVSECCILEGLEDGDIVAKQIVEK